MDQILLSTLFKSPLVSNFFLSISISQSPKLLISCSECILPLQNFPMLMFWEVLQHEVKLPFIVYFPLQSHEHFDGRDPVQVPNREFYNITFLLWRLSQHPKMWISHSEHISLHSKLTGLMFWEVLQHEMKLMNIVYFLWTRFESLPGNFFSYFFCSGECQSLPKHGWTTQNVSHPIEFNLGWYCERYCNMKWNYCI